MNIGIIGAGNIAGTVGVLWAKAGHAVQFGTRHPETLGPLLAKAGSAASSGSPTDAAAFGEVVFCSVPYGAWPTLAPTLAPLLAGKVVIDSANPYPERDGAFARDVLAAGEGSGLPVARLLPGARLVRGFNSVYFKLLETEAHRAGDRIGIPLAGDDQEAVAVTARLVREAGFDPVVVGGLARAREFDPGTAVYNTGMSGADLASALGISAARAVIVGVGPGLGAALARRFAAGGFAVTGLARDPARLDEIEGASLHRADAADLPGLAAAITRDGPVQALIYNAYRATMAPNGPAGLDPAALVEDFRVNVAGALAAVQAVLPGMRAAGRGSILLTGGGLALDPTGWLPAASLAVGKAGLRSLAQTLHKQLAPEGIHVATVTVVGQIQPGTAFDPELIADRFWQLHAQPAGLYDWESVFQN